MAIDALNLAKEAMGMTLAKAALGSAGDLLTTIRVGFLPVRVGRFLVNVCTGFIDRQSRLRRTGADLR